MNKRIILPEEIRSAQFEDTYFPIVDGVVRTVHNYASIMNKETYCCVVCPEQKGTFDYESLPYDVIRTAAFKGPAMNYSLCLPFNAKTIRKVKEAGPIDIVHAHSPFMEGHTAVRTARKLGIPMVATFHSKYYDDALMVTKSKTLAKITVKYIIDFYNKCDSVWACSEGTAETLRSYGYKKDIFVCHNGSDFEIPKDSEKLEEYAIHKFSLTPDRKTILFVGSLVWQKNLKCVLDTFRILCNQNPMGYRLLIVGTGNHEKAIKAYADKLNFTSDQLAFAGGISNRKILSGIFAAADLFFFPSVYDNAPLVLREAAAMGTPALLVRGSNSAEVVVPDVSGFVAENNEKCMAAKIKEIFADESLIKAAGNKAKETIPVSWESIIPIVRDKYAEVIRNFSK